MDARIESKGRILLAGMGFYGDPFGNASAWDEENEIGSLWKRFMAFISSRPEAFPAASGFAQRWFELHLMGGEMARTGRYEVFVGAEIDSPEGFARISPALSGKVLPASEYAVLTLSGNEISSDWRGALYAETVPGLGRKADESLCVDLYDERFKGMDRLAESTLEVWVPLLPWEGA